MSKERAAYPSRPERRGRPKSSSSGGRKSKTWLSLRDVTDNGRDISPRLNTSWWKAPMYRVARLAKWAH